MISEYNLQKKKNRPGPSFWMLQISYKETISVLNPKFFLPFICKGTKEGMYKKPYEYQLVFVKTARGFTEYK